MKRKNMRKARIDEERKKQRNKEYKERRNR